MDVADLRALIPAANAVTYLNSGWEGPSPLPVVRAISDFLSEQSVHGPTVPPMLEREAAVRTAARAAFARLLGATPAETVLTDNTTHGLNIVLSGLSWQPGDEIIIDDLEHPSGLVLPFNLRERFGVAVKVVHLDAQDGEEAIVSRLEQAITPHARLFLLSHIMYSNGLRLPIPAINAMAHSHGVRVLVDGAQTAGQIPLDVAAWDCDFYAVPGHKWLLGPQGTGALYVRKELMPEVATAHVNPYAALYFDLSTEYVPATFKPEKFEQSTPSAALHAGVTAAMELLEEVGLENVQAHWESLAAYLRRELRELPGAQVTSPPAGPTSSGLVTFQIEGWEAQPLVEALWATEKVVVRSVFVPPGIRASLHYFNTTDDIDRLVGALRGIVS